MQPDHEPAALSKGREIDSERSIFTVLATWRCGPLMGRGVLLLGRACVIVGAIPREARVTRLPVSAASFQQNVSSVG